MTAPQIDALIGVLEFAIADQEDYLQFGQTNTDYGDEWPEVGRARAAHFREVAAFLRREALLCMLRASQQSRVRMADRLDKLANSLQASADEYEATS